MKNLNKTPKKEDIEKILFGDDTTVCFACGEKLSVEDIDSGKCPYCGIDLPQKDVKSD